MRDFNYFDPYIKVQAKPKGKVVLFVILAALILALVVYYQYYLIMQVRGLEADIKEVDDYINAESTLRKVSEVSDKQTKEAGLTMAYNDLSTLAMSIEMTDTLDEMFIDKVNAQVPFNLFVSEFNGNYQYFTVKGYPTEYDAIAQFAFNLRNSGSFKDVNIPSVVQDGGNYVYLINATIVKEGVYEN
ncbi:MAG TPA: hypothetical protein DCS67_03790 [Clostridiales bacterium UBA8960]|nr:hypothetical protein [Clostridiales bacterium UBA8960]